MACWGRDQATVGDGDGEDRTTGVGVAGRTVAVGEAAGGGVPDTTCGVGLAAGPGPHPATSRARRAARGEILDFLGFMGSLP